MEPRTFFRVARLLPRSVFFFVALVASFAILSPYFLTASNAQNIVIASAVLAILSLAQTFVIAAGGIDLSIGSIMAFCATASAIALHLEEFTAASAIAASIGVGACAGAVNGVLINFTRAPSFIITLGMLSMMRAAAYIISGGTPIYGLREEVIQIGQGSYLGVAGPIWFVVCAGLVSYILLHQTAFGVHAHAAGDREASARAAGIDLSRLRLRVFCASGALSGLAGFLFMARTNSGDPSAGQSYELIAITAVVLGGARLSGGRASVIGTLLGTLCLGILQNGLNLLAVSTYFQVLFVGAVLVLAATLDRFGGTHGRA